MKYCIFVQIHNIYLNEQKQKKGFHETIFDKLLFKTNFSIFVSGKTDANFITLTSVKPFSEEIQNIFEGKQKLVSCVNQKKYSKAPPPQGQALSPPPP